MVKLSFGVSESGPDDLLEDDMVDRPAGPTAIILHFVLQVAQVAAWVWLAITLGISMYLLLTDGGLTGEDLLVMNSFPKHVMIRGFAILVLGAIVALLVTMQLLAISKTLLKGDPFVPVNAKRLRYIWIFIAVGEIIRTLLAWSISKYVFENSTLNFANSWLGDATGMNFGSTEVAIRLSPWLFVFILIALSQVFREGARLRQEQKYTV